MMQSMPLCQTTEAAVSFSGGGDGISTGCTQLIDPPPPPPPPHAPPPPPAPATPTPTSPPLPTPPQAKAWQNLTNRTLPECRCERKSAFSDFGLLQDNRTVAGIVFGQEIKLLSQYSLTSSDKSVSYKIYTKA